jgi:5-guanidino-2-oxopentanoate decarboxylase
VVGGGAVNCGDLVLRLARRIAAPVITTVNGKGTISERDPLSLGAALRLQACHRFLRSRAVVLAIGTEFAESDLWRKPPIDLDGRMVRIDIDPDQIHKNQDADLGIVADARVALAALLERIPTGRRGLPHQSLAPIRELFVKEALADGEPYIELMTRLRAALPAEAIIVGDSAMACYFGAVHFLQVDAPRRYLHPTGFATLGYALPGAIGAKLAAPTSPVVALSGDGGFQFTLQELATAVDLRQNLPVVIVDNNGYGEIRREMLESGITPLGVDLGPVDFVALAKAYGARGTTLADLSSLPALLAEALKAPVPTVIRVTV